jgi:exodeoxyribonuclease V alpha subunit
VVFRGDFVVHPNYGVQFKAVSYEESEPEDLDSIERYLGSGAIKGIGAALAGRIVKKFKNDTFRIIEEEPERLAEVKGISSRMAMEIADQVVEKKEMRRAMLYLQELGIGMNLAVKIYKKYGDALYQTMETNPYRLADDIEGVGFKIADEIAGKMGMAKDSPDRIKSGILYTLQQAVAGGHVFLPKDMLLERSGNILGTEIEEGEELLMDMIIAGKIMVKPIDGESVVYPRALYNTESMVANKLVRLNNRYEIDEEYFEHRLSVIEHKEELELDKLQRRAVKEAESLCSKYSSSISYLL